MSNRITAKNLDSLAETLTAALHRINYLSPGARIVRDSAYGGHRLVTTGGPNLPNGSIHTGQFGLHTGYNPARLTYDNAKTVLNMASEAHYFNGEPRY